ncbi:hypothetical protein E2P81_ATG05576 [Venturia nashicola]|nr:hypothetical protein E2P81_ATG05576 [Venturia nashicola]
MHVGRAWEINGYWELCRQSQVLEVVLVLNWLLCTREKTIALAWANSFNAKDMSWTAPDDEIFSLIRPGRSVPRPCADPQGTRTELQRCSLTSLRCFIGLMGMLEGNQKLTLELDQNLPFPMPEDIPLDPFPSGHAVLSMTIRASVLLALLTGTALARTHSLEPGECYTIYSCRPKNGICSIPSGTTTFTGFKEPVTTRPALTASCSRSTVSHTVYASRPHTCDCHRPTSDHVYQPRPTNDYTPPRPGRPQEPLREQSPNCDTFSTIYDPRACKEHPLYQRHCDHYHSDRSFEKCCTHDSKCPDYDARCDYHRPNYDPRECPYNSAYDDNCDSFKKPVRKEECPDHPNAWIPPSEPTNSFLTTRIPVASTITISTTITSILTISTTITSVPTSSSPCAPGQSNASRKPHPDPCDPNYVTACLCNVNQQPTRQEPHDNDCNSDYNIPTPDDTNACSDINWNMACANQCPDSYTFAGIEYIKKCDIATFLTMPEVSKKGEYSGPKECLEKKCNDRADCLGVEWEQGIDICHVHIRHPSGRPAITQPRIGHHLFYKKELEGLVA